MITPQFGLLTYTTKNIGDDIQSLAAAQFLPRIDAYIDREFLQSYHHKGDLFVIFNGWFKQRKCDWPPPDNIRPLFISFHITQYNNAHELLAAPALQKYYQQFAPIGCRDFHTMHLLHNIGVDAYFSGCLTLTLQHPAQSAKRDHIYLVDPFGSTPGYRFPLPGDADFDRELLERLPPVLRQNGIFLSHETLECNPHKRLAMARLLLEKYATARLVVTSRLHCALPCLAMGTPVLFVYKNRDDPRLGGFLELLHSCPLEDLLKDDVLNWEDPSPNPVDTNPLAESLRRNCRMFVDTITAIPT